MLKVVGERHAQLDGPLGENQARDAAEKGVEQKFDERETSVDGYTRYKSFLRWLLAIAAVLCVAGIVVAIRLPELGRRRELARRSSSQDNLKELFLVFQIYSLEDPGKRFPPVSPYPGVWAPDLRVLYPKYLQDPSILINPLNMGPETAEDLKAALDRGDFERAARIAARNYTYTGWALRDEKDVETIRKVLPTLSWDQLDQDITADGHTVYRLREGIERFIVTDINDAAMSAGGSVIQIAFTNMAIAKFRYTPPGCNLLYLDGHVAFYRAGTFPAVPAVAETFSVPEIER